MVPTCARMRCSSCVAAGPGPAGPWPMLRLLAGLGGGKGAPMPLMAARGVASPQGGGGSAAAGRPTGVSMPGRDGGGAGRAGGEKGWEGRGWEGRGGRGHGRG